MAGRNVPSAQDPGKGKSSVSELSKRFEGLKTKSRSDPVAEKFKLPGDDAIERKDKLKASTLHPQSGTVTTGTSDTARLSSLHPTGRTSSTTRQGSAPQSSVLQRGGTKGVQPKVESKDILQKREIKDAPQKAETRTITRINTTTTSSSPNKSDSKDIGMTTTSRESKLSLKSDTGETVKPNKTPQSGAVQKDHSNTPWRKRQNETKASAKTTQQINSNKVQPSIEERLKSLTSITEPTRLAVEISDVYVDILDLADTDKRTNLLSELKKDTNRVLDKELVQLLSENSLSDQALFLFYNGITTVSSLARYIYSIADNAKKHKDVPAVKSNPWTIIDNHLGKKLECLGALAFNNVDVSASWVRSLTRECPSIEKLQKLNCNQLKKYINSASPLDQTTVEHIYISANLIRTEVKVYGMELAVAELLEKRGITSAREINEAIYVETLKKIPGDQKLRFKRMYANQLDRKRQEVVQKRAEFYKERMPEALELIKQIRKDSTIFMESNRDLLQDKMDSLGTILQLKTKCNMHQVKNPKSMVIGLEHDIQVAHDHLMTDLPIQTLEDILAESNGGLPLTGVYLAGNTLETTAKRPPQLLLKKPKFLESVNSVEASKSFFFLSTKAAVLELFLKSVTSSGFSRTKIAFEFGHDGYFAESDADLTQLINSTVIDKKRTGKYATAVKVTTFTAKAFKFYLESIELTEEAKTRARWLEDSGAGRVFIENFGSHICLGTHQFGGALFQIITLNLKDYLDEATLLQTVKQYFQMENTSGFNVLETEKNIKFKVVKGTTHEGLVNIKNCAVGPSISNTDILKIVLEHASSTCCVIDRGSRGLLVPVWDLLCKLGDEYKESATMIKHAWQSQAVFIPSPLKIKSLDVDTSLIDGNTCSLRCKTEMQEMKRCVQQELEICQNRKEDIILASLAHIFKIIIATQESIGSERNALAEALQMPSLIDCLKTVISQPPEMFSTVHTLLRTVLDKKTRDNLPDMDLQLLSFLKEQSKYKQEITVHRYRDILKLVDNLRHFADRIDSGEVDEYSLRRDVTRTLGEIIKYEMDSEIKVAVSEETARYGYTARDEKLTHPLTASELTALARCVERILTSRFNPGDQVSYLSSPANKAASADKNGCFVEGSGKVISVSGNSARVAWDASPQSLASTDNINDNMWFPFWKLERNEQSGHMKADTYSKGSNLFWRSKDVMLSLEKGDSCKLNFSDFCNDRPSTSTSLTSTQNIMDSLRHRTEILTQSKVVAKAPHMSERSQKETLVTGHNVFTSLIELLQGCNLSANIELFRQLLDQRYTIPLIGPSSDMLLFKFYVEALRYVNFQLWNNSYNLISEVEFPRVAFLSRTEIGLSQNANMVSQVMQCNITSARCKQTIGTTAELGLGFTPNRDSSKFDAWLILYIRGNYKQLSSVINQFADIIIIELDQAENPKHTTTAGIIVTRNQQVLRWQNTHKAIEVIDQTSSLSICGTFHDVADQLQHALIHYRSTCQKFPHNPLRYLNSPVLSVQNEIGGLDEIESLIKNLDFESIRTNLVLQNSFAKESSSRLVMQRVRTSHGKVEAIRSEMNDEVLFRRRAAYDQYRLPILLDFVKLLSEQDCNLRVVGLLHFENILNHCCDTLLKIERQKLNRAWEAYQTNTKDSEALAHYYTAKKEFTEKGISLEHLWRELSHIYSAQPGNFNHLPRLAAQHLLDGFALEIMDGDAGSVNVQWFKAVMAALDAQLTSELGRKAKVFTISAMGTQSTGKSTLLNTMFGCRLRTSAGQTTRGVNLQLVRAENRDVFDIVLVIDTEGIRSPEFYGTEGAVWRDNRIATFAVLPADTCLITTVSEEDSAIKEVLPIVMLAFKGSNIAERTAGRMSSLALFVYSRVDTSPQALRKFQQNREQLRIDLKEAAIKIAGEKVAGDGTNEEVSSDNTLKTLESVLPHFQTNENQAASDVKYLGVLNKGEMPPNDSPNFLYGASVIEIREYIQRRLLKNGFQGQTLINWVDYFELVLQCINTTDFEMNFKTAMEYRAYSDLESKIIQIRQIVAQQYSSMYATCESDILNAAREPSVEDAINKLERNVRNVVQEQSFEVEKTLKEPTNKVFENSELSQWRYFLEDQRKTWANLLTSVFDNKWKFSLVVEKYEQSIIHQLRQQWKIDKKSLQDERAEQLFESIFKKHVTEARKENAQLDIEQKIITEYERLGHVNVLSLGRHFSSNMDQLVDKFNDKETIKLIAEHVEMRIRGLLSNMIRYDAAVVQQAILLSAETISKNITNKEAANIIHTMMCQVLVKHIRVIQNEWDSKHNIGARLESSKSRLRDKFRSICQGFVGARLISVDLVGGIQQAMVEGYAIQLALDVKANIQSQSWVGRADVMQGHIDMDLINIIKTNNTARLLDCLADSEGHYRTVLYKLIGDCAEIDRTWKNLITVTINAVRRASIVAGSSAQNKGQGFRTELTKKLPSSVKMKLKHSMWNDIDQEGDPLTADNWKEVGQIVENQLKTWEKNYTPKVSRDELGQLVAELLGREGRNSARQRCSTPCPRCRMTCIKHAGHELEPSDVARLHDCSHQPLGLSGNLWVKHPKYHNELIAETCTDLVASPGHLRHGEKWVRWSKFTEIYPMWAFPTISQRQKVREFIFYVYQRELTRKYVSSKAEVCSYMPTHYNHKLDNLEEECRSKSVIIN